METRRSDESTVLPVGADLLGFGVELFHAALAGNLPSDYLWTEGEPAIHVGINAVISEIDGHGLELEEELSLLYRILAFGRLIEQMAEDPRTHGHIAASSEGYEVSDALVRLAASASMMTTDDGRLVYDPESVARGLAN
ncbi:hypothetical protein M8R20_27665 [Pseudomonas sp. R2.Fl]|nr:hypothetical protein [Pseudomonas sp. R2.Fl]